MSSVMTVFSKSFLQQLAYKACERYSLKRVYFAEILGKRRHFLAGAGQEAFLPLKCAALKGSLMVFWQGELPCAEEEFLAFLKKEINRGLSCER